MARVASYYSSESERSERMGWMPAAVLPSHETDEQLKSQLAKITHPADGQFVFIEDGGERHDFDFLLSQNVMTHTVMHYGWPRPED